MHPGTLMEKLQATMTEQLRAASEHENCEPGRRAETKAKLLLVTRALVKAAQRLAHSLEASSMASREPTPFPGAYVRPRHASHSRSTTTAEEELLSQILSPTPHAPRT